MTAPAAMQHDQGSFLTRNHAWTLAAGALFLRLAVFFFILVRFGDAGFILPPFSDAHGYVTIAHNILDGHGFSLSEHAPYPPDTKRVPLYPLYLAATFALTGGALWLAALLQTVLGAGITFFIYKVTDTIAGRRAAFFAGALAAMYPFEVFLSTQLLAETLFTVILFSAFALFMYALVSPSYRIIIASGLLMGLATLVKPAAQYIPFLLLPFIVWRMKSAQRIIAPVIFIACVLLVISPWVIRNHNVSGVATVSYEANILFDLHIAGYTAFKETGTAARFDEYRSARTEEQLLAISRGAYMRRVLVIAAHDPIGFSHYLLLTTVPFVFGDGFVTMVVALSPNPSLPAWDFSSSASALGRTIGFGVLPPMLLILSIASKALWGLVLIGTAVGFIRLMRDGGERRLIGLAIALVTAYFMFAGGPVQSARYRMPVEPLIFMLAGVGLGNLVQVLGIHRRRRFGLPTDQN